MTSACPRRVSLITAKGTAVHSVSNHRRYDRGSPGCQRIYSRPDRLRRSLADSPIHTDRIEFTATSHPGTPVLRTGRSRCVALHPGLLRRSYVSIPHGSSPHRGGLSPPYPLALSGARARPSRSYPSASRRIARTHGHANPGQEVELEQTETTETRFPTSVTSVCS